MNILSYIYNISIKKANNFYLLAFFYKTTLYSFSSFSFVYNLASNESSFMASSGISNENIFLGSTDNMYNKDVYAI